MDYGKSNDDPKTWDGKCYTVPKDGVYHLYISYLRDSQVPQGGGEPGTNGDTHVIIRVCGKQKAYAWAGEGGASHQAASTSVILPLREGDEVTTYDFAEENKFRRFRHCVFTCFRVGKLS